MRPRGRRPIEVDCIDVRRRGCRAGVRINEAAAGNGFAAVRFDYDAGGEVFRACCITRGLCELEELELSL